MAAAMSSICFFTVDSIDRTILNDSEAESEDFILQNENRIKEISQTKIWGRLSPSFFVTDDDTIIGEQNQKNAISINDSMPQTGEILLNQQDLTYLRMSLPEIWIRKTRKI